MQSTFRRGGILAGVLIGLGILLVLVVATTVVAGLFIARHVAVRETSRGTVVETPFGSVRVKENARVDPRLLGVPLYPGATRLEDPRKQASIELDFDGESKQLNVLVAVYTTPDPLDKVAAFYREKLGSWKYTRNSSGRVKLESSQDGSKRVVAISGRDGLTKIALASAGEPASN